MSNPIRVGIAGIGRAGWGMHCQELENKKDKFQFVAACDLLEDRTAKMAERYGCRVYRDIQDLIRDPEVELVDIATRSNDHFRHAMMALEAGKDVLLEKPMCETYEQAVKLKELGSRPGGPRLYVRHNRRFEYNFEKIKEIMASGILGYVYEIHITRDSYSRRDDWQTIKEFGGGQLLNWGPHIIDQSLRFLDGPVKDVYGDLKHVVAAGDCEDHLTILLRDHHGRTVQMQISGGVAKSCPEYTAYGTKGALEIVNNKIFLKYLDPDQVLPEPVANPETPQALSFGASGTFSGGGLPWIEKVIDERQEDLSIIWDYLYDSYRNGKPFPITLEEAISVIWVISEVKRNTEFE